MFNLLDRKPATGDWLLCHSVCLPVGLPVCLSVCLPACQPASLPASLPVCLSVCLYVSMSACLSARLPVCLPACLPACLSVCMSACLSVCLSVDFTSVIGILAHNRPVDSTMRRIQHTVAYTAIGGAAKRNWHSIWNRSENAAANDCIFGLLPLERGNHHLS